MCGLPCAFSPIICPQGFITGEKHRLREAFHWSGDYTLFRKAVLASFFFLPSLVLCIALGSGCQSLRGLSHSSMLLILLDVWQLSLSWMVNGYEEALSLPDVGGCVCHICFGLSSPMPLAGCFPPMARLLSGVWQRLIPDCSIRSIALILHHVIVCECVNVCLCVCEQLISIDLKVSQGFESLLWMDYCTYNIYLKSFLALN